jgi:hypothetical protein
VDVELFEASIVDQIEPAVDSEARAGHEALLVTGGGLTARYADLIGSLALRYRMASISPCEAPVAS